MTKQDYPVPKSNPNAQMSITFLLLWPANALIIYLANLLLPQQIVLGTAHISETSALVLSSGILAWIATLTLPIFTQIEIRNKMVLAPQHWMIGYLIINTIAVWTVARFADTIGLGMASWAYVLGLAIALDLAQGATMSVYGEAKKNQ